MNSGDRWGPIWHTSDTALAQADGSWITEGAEARQAGGKTAPQCVCIYVCVGACELGLFTQDSDANSPCPGVPLNWSGWTSHTSHLRKSEQAQKVLSVSSTVAHMEKEPVRLDILRKVQGARVESRLDLDALTSLSTAMSEIFEAKAEQRIHDPTTVPI